MTSLIKIFAKRAKYYSLAIGILLTPAILFAVTNDVAETAAPTKTSLFELVFVKGGVFMYIILLLSVGMVYLIVDAFMLIKAEKLMPENTVKHSGCGNFERWCLMPRPSWQPSKKIWVMR